MPAEHIVTARAEPAVAAPRQSATAPAGPPRPEPPTAPAPAVAGRIETPVGLLPQRNPGASGITAGPAPAPNPPETPDPPETPNPPETPAPADTSAFFAARDRARQSRPAEDGSTGGAGDAIYRSMVSEWLIDPAELANSRDLDWKSVWDHGFTKAAEAADAPVRRHTEEGLPMREPGARLVPGSMQRPVSSAADAGPDEPGPPPRRDPEAVRAGLAGHFSGVRAGRAAARETQGPDPR